MRRQLKKKKKNIFIQIKGKSHYCCSNVWRTSLSLRLDLGEMWAQLFGQTLWDAKKKKGKSSGWSQKRWLWFPSIYTNTHTTGTNQPRILKEPYMTQKGHCGDYPMPQKISFFFFFFNLIYVFPGGTQIHSREGRRWAERRCFPKDKRYVNKQLQRKWKSTLPSCYLAGPPQYCVWGCVPDGVNPRLNDWD